MVGRTLPAPRVAGDPEIADAILQSARDPDVIQPAAAITYGPVGGTIAPPGIDLLRERNPHPRHVEPFAMGLCRQELLAFDRGVRDDLEELLVRPHVVFMRRDVEVADQ